MQAKIRCLTPDGMRDPVGWAQFSAATRIRNVGRSLVDWQLQGACRHANPELFFNPEGERGAQRLSRRSQAIAVCEGCPVVQSCRDHALKVPEPY